MLLRRHASKLPDGQQRGIRPTVPRRKRSPPVAGAERRVVGGPDLLDETLDLGAVDPVIGEHPGEDLDRRLELFGYDIVRAQANELGDLDHIAGARDDVDTRIEPARDPHHAPVAAGSDIAATSMRARSIPRART